MPRPYRNRHQTVGPCRNRQDLLRRYSFFSPNFLRSSSTTALTACAICLFFMLLCTSLGDSNLRLLVVLHDFWLFLKHCLCSECQKAGCQAECQKAGCQAHPLEPILGGDLLDQGFPQGWKPVIIACTHTPALPAPTHPPPSPGNPKTRFLTTGDVTMHLTTSLPCPASPSSPVMLTVGEVLGIVHVGRGSLKSLATWTPRHRPCRITNWCDDLVNG